MRQNQNSYQQFLSAYQPISEQQQAGLRAGADVIQNLNDYQLLEATAG